MSNHPCTATIVARSEKESSTPIEDAPPRQLSLFKFASTRGEPLECIEVAGPCTSGKSRDSHLQSRSSVKQSVG